MVLPADVDANVIAPVLYDQVTFVAATNKLPKILNDVVPLKLQNPVAGPLIERFAHTTAPETVTEYDAAFDPELNIALSAAVGTDAPPAPPDVTDQFVVLVNVQLAVPPTQ
jgi:hypothetical protein